MIKDWAEQEAMFSPLYKPFAQRGAWTHDPGIKSPMLYPLS